MNHDHQLPESASSSAVTGAAGNIVQAAAIHGDVHVTQVVPLHSDLDVVRRAQDQAIAAYRRLDDVQAQLAHVQQQLLDSVKAERNITQLVLVLQFVVMRLQDMVSSAFTTLIFVSRRISYQRTRRSPSCPPSMWAPILMMWMRSSTASGITSMTSTVACRTSPGKLTRRCLGEVRSLASGNP